MAALVGSVVAVGMATSAEAVATTSVATLTATSKPTMTVSKLQTTVTTKPYTMKTTYKLPVLHGSTAANRATVKQRALAIIANKKASVKRAWADCERRGTCDDLPPVDAGVRVTKVAVGVYQGRYASFTLEGLVDDIDVDKGSAGTEAFATSFTLDLKTGKKVPLSKFVDISDYAARIAIVSTLFRERPGCVRYDLTPERNSTTQMSLVGQPAAWTVSSSGLRVAYPRYVVGLESCNIMSVTVPWTDIATVNRMDGPVYTRVYVNGLTRADGQYWGAVAYLTVQDRRAALVAGYIDSDSECYAGARTSTQARLFERWSFERWTPKLGGTYKQPTIALGTGWRKATATERSRLAEQFGQSFNAIRTCRF
ncbi:hypothetical protein [Demequina silvatica]|uniref:hypothetical protein n=1 Tax=Demequina silvatica TaxID=1638988 RepID=UPI0007812286|nr:hypothetical protein [Demequina silvatica]